MWAAEGQEFLAFGEMLRHLSSAEVATGARVALLRELNRQAARMAPSVAIPALIVALRVCPGALLCMYLDHLTRGCLVCRETGSYGSRVDDCQQDKR